MIELGNRTKLTTDVETVFVELGGALSHLRAAPIICPTLATDQT